MKLAFLSDIHGNLLALQAVLADLVQHKVDTVINLGDSLSGPLLPQETAEFLMQQSWVQLAGNHERQLLDFDPDRCGPSDRYAHSLLTPDVFAWLKSLPSNASIGDEILLCHGTPASDLEYFLETVTPDFVRTATAYEIEQRLGDTPAQLIACGHTHLPRVVRTRTGKLIVNPGSVGLPASDDVKPFPHRMETGAPDARYAIVEKRNGQWSAALLTIPYHYEAAVELARKRGRPEWESALRSGYLLPGEPVHNVS